MNLDADDLITVPAPTRQDGDEVIIDLREPFITDKEGSQLSRLKLLSGNEQGVSLSIDGNQLIIDLSAYSVEGEPLCYSYQIEGASHRFSEHTATINLSLTEEGSAEIVSASLTSDQPLVSKSASINDSESSIVSAELSEIDQLIAEIEGNDDVTIDSVISENESPDIEADSFDYMATDDTALEDFSATEDDDFSIESIDMSEYEDSLAVNTETVDCDDSSVDAETYASDDSVELEGLSASTENSTDWESSSEAGPTYAIDEFEIDVDDHAAEGLLEIKAMDEPNIDLASVEPVLPNNAEDATGGFEQDDIPEPELEPEAISDNTLSDINDNAGVIESEEPAHDEQSGLSLTSAKEETGSSGVDFHFTTTDESHDPATFSFSPVGDPEPEGIDETTISYEELTPEEHVGDDERANLDRIINEVDQAIAEADKLLESALTVHPADDGDDRPSAETALEGIIESLPGESDENHTLSTAIDSDATQALEQVIDEVPIAKPLLESPLPGASDFLSQPVPTLRPGIIKKVSILASEPYIFSQEDVIPATSSSAQPLDKIRVGELPNTGRIFYNKKRVKQGQEISRLDLLTGRLTFEPDSNTSKTEMVSLTFCLPNDGQSPSPVKANDELSTITLANGVTLSLETSVHAGNLLVASGNVMASEHTSGEFILCPGVIKGEYGAFIVNHNGFWTYEVDSSQPLLNELKKGEFLDEQVTLNTENESTYTIDLRILKQLHCFKILILSVV